MLFSVVFLFGEVVCTVVNDGQDAAHHHRRSRPLRNARRFQRKPHHERAEREVHQSRILRLLRCNPIVVFHGYQNLIALKRASQFASVMLLDTPVVLLSKLNVGEGA